MSGKDDLNSRIRRAAGRGVPTLAPPDDDDGEEQAAKAPSFDAGARSTNPAPLTPTERINRLIRSRPG